MIELLELLLATLASACFDESHHLGDTRAPSLRATLDGVDPAQPGFPIEGRERLERRLPLRGLRPTCKRLSDVRSQLFRLRALRPYRDRHLSRYMACVTSSRRRAVLVDQAAETVETYDLVVAAGRASRRQAQVPEVGCLPGTCVRALKRPIFLHKMPSEQR